MFIRWKKGKDRHSAYLVKSVRKDGKPRQEVIAHLVSMHFDPQGGLTGWAHLEMRVQELALSEQERTLVYHLFAQKVPRPPDEMLAREKKKIVALLAQIDQYKAPVVPANPPVRLDMALQENDSLAITWAVKIDLQKQVLYTASLQREETVIELGTIDRIDLDSRYIYGQQRFWLGAHSALCLADVGYKVYETTLRMLETWVPPLPPDGFTKAMQWGSYNAETKVVKEKRSLYRKLDKLDAKQRELRTIRSREEKYLASLSCSGEKVQL